MTDDAPRSREDELLAEVALLRRRLVEELRPNVGVIGADGLLATVCDGEFLRGLLSASRDCIKVLDLGGNLSATASDYFLIPAPRVVEMGTRIEL